MSNNGAAYPDKVDLISKSDSYIKLIVVQTEPLTDALLKSLQEKLNNYIAFAKDGQLYEIEPDAKNLPIIISIDLFENGNKLTIEFLEKIKLLFAKENVLVEWQEIQHEYK